VNLGRLNLVDLALFARVLPLVARAQRVRTVPIRELVADLGRRGGDMTGYPVDRLSLAADRAAGRWTAWFGGMNTCLVRSLALGALLVDRGDVVLNVGFRSGDDPEPRLAGHAWVTVNGQPVGSDGDLAGICFTRVLEVPYRASDQGNP
jgi:hypothetical protein